MSTGDLIKDALNYHQAKKFAEAEELYLEVLKTTPDNIDALNLLGLLKLQNNQYKEAIFYIEKATELKPCAYFFSNLGLSYCKNENFVEAITNYKKALNLEPDNFDALFNLAIAYKNIGNLDESLNFYNSALKIKPDCSEVYFNMANIYEFKNETLNALEYYKKAAELNPNDNAINYFLSITYLKTKNFEEGWKHYESRPSRKFSILTQSKEYKSLVNKPIWNGESLENKTLFVYYEAGLGDTIMFSRYINLLKDKGGKILFKPQYNLASLFKNCDLGAEIIDINCNKEEMGFDFHIPIMSLPFALSQKNQNYGNIPLTKGYLSTDATKTSELKNIYFKTDKLKIGIKWQGNPSYETNRIIPLSAFCKLFENSNTKFYSIQKGSGIEELKNIQNDYDITDLNPVLNDFSDTAAVLENLDLVICNDTSVAHLAGAMGKPCWILLPFVQNWRWTTDTSNCLWYDSVRLFHQKQRDDWEKVLDEVHQALKDNF